MPTLQPAHGGGHAQQVPQAPRATGPWGEAIRYWLKERNWLQAELAIKTGIRPTTISRATRGFHTTTRVLDKIAQAFEVSLDDVLVSPARKMANDARRRLAAEIAEDVLRRMETRTAAPLEAVVTEAVTSADQLARRLQTDALAKKPRRRSS